MIVETDSSPTTFCPTPVKNIPYPRARRTNGKGGTPGQRPPLSHLPEESARIVWSWASFVFASEREALDTLALRFTEPHGPRPHCPLCGAAVVMDGGPGKERCERRPSSKRFRCKECARKLAFTSTLEGTVATALLAVRDLLIAQWLPASGALRVWAVCRIIGALAQPLNQPVAIIHLDGSHRGGRVVIGLVPPGGVTTIPRSPLRGQRRREKPHPLGCGRRRGRPGGRERRRGRHQEGGERSPPRLRPHKTVPRGVEGPGSHPLVCWRRPAHAPHPPGTHSRRRKRGCPGERP